MQQKSISETEVKHCLIDTSAPPVPPLPACYKVDYQKIKGMIYILFYHTLFILIYLKEV